MRILLAIRHAYTDPFSGAARSVRTELQWLREQGHECRVLCSDEFDASRTNVREHLDGLGVTIRRRRAFEQAARAAPRPDEVCRRVGICRFRPA